MECRQGCLRLTSTQHLGLLVLSRAVSAGGNSPCLDLEAKWGLAWSVLRWEARAVD